MHTLIALGAISLGGLSLASVPALEARDCCQGHHDCCHGHHNCPMMSGAQANAPRPAPYIYDASTVSTMRGTAGAVTVVPGRGGRGGGTHLTLEAPDGTVDVRLGPTWYLEREGVTIAKGDSIEVTGSVLEWDGESVLIARELRKGGKVVTLRDERGVPLWAGGQP
jgi:hypothetical protein